MLLAMLLRSMSGAIFGTGAHVTDVMEFVLFRLPSLAVLCLPVAMLVASALAVARLSRDNELAALRIGTVGFKRVVRPIAVAGLVMAGVAFLLNEHLVPRANRLAEQVVRRAILRQPYRLPLVAGQSVFEGQKQMFFYVGRIDKRMQTLHDVMSVQLTASGRPQVALVAPRATSSERVWRLQDGKEYQFDQTGKVTSSQHFTEKTVDLAEAIQNFLVEERSAQEMSSTELKRQIEVLGQGGVPEAEHLLLELNLKYSIPLACLVLGVLGALVTARVAHGGVFSGVLLSALVVFLYNGTMNWSRALGETGLLHPIAAAWAHNVLFGGLALILYFLQD